MASETKWAVWVLPMQSLLRICETEMTKIYSYFQIGGTTPKDITEDEVVHMYWPFYQNIQKRMGVPDSELTREKCIAEWKGVYRAWVKRPTT